MTFIGYKMTKAEKMASFLEALKASGIVISDEKRLQDRLEKAIDVEVELIKVAENSRLSGITFTADMNARSDGLVAAFKDHGFDGFTFKYFIPHLKAE